MEFFVMKIDHAKLEFDLRASVEDRDRYDASGNQERFSMISKYLKPDLEPPSFQSMVVDRRDPILGALGVHAKYP